MSEYDAWAPVYDDWAADMIEDIPYYAALAREADGPVVELGVGTGRIAIPIAQAGVDVIGVDSSEGMLAVAREAAAEVGVAERLDLRTGDLRDPPVDGPVPLVICPFRAFLHLHTDAERIGALSTVHSLLHPGARFIFDVFTPAQDDIEETHGRWIEREPGIFERADWDTGSRTLTLSVKGPGGQTTMVLAWLAVVEWRMLLQKSGFEVEACYGWFDRRRYAGGEDSIWIARRPTV
jgi:SAM-dependent methyltransferase